ncbi:SNF2 family DNA-dependent ATPase [Mycena alexandri]|uniref:SNF2 family DNA-dependent ATPase n=1 Tax=Mycena alexandri TaxID=1745969 RepID=A0AAD6SDK3_9AGAR|nr:SNF2 family DNA-dependent ATPase [Mycena alexandri]
MEKPSTQASRILEALHVAAGASQDASYGTLATRTPLQDSNTPHPEAGGSNLKRRARPLDLARQVQAKSLGDSGAIADAGFLSSSLNSSPMVAGGFQLNYDQDTPVRAIDIGGHDQEERMAEFVTRSLDNLSDGLTVKESMRELGLDTAQDLLPGLEVRLLAHQAIGVAWMLKRERSRDKGGILADDMGLGKTVQMIATMAMNLPGPNEEARTTLIVVPAALLQQWKDEIESKTNEMFTVRLHHGKDKLRKTSEVKEYDVVITTYQTLSMDFHIPKDVEPDEETQWLAKHGGVLAKCRWYRAIADEAQYIRNRSTKASLSLAHVRAKYRWMLTGTPVTNTLADIYGLLRFGRFRPWNDFNAFNEHVAKVQLSDAPLAGQRAQMILKPLLLRRTKTSTLEGKPILTLPRKDVEIVTLKFTPEEREIYDSFEKRSKISLNRFIRAGTLVKNHAAVLVMILRLRQLCCHPHLILSIAEGQGFGDPTLLMGSDTEKERGRALNLMGKPWVDSVKRRFLIRTSAAELLDDDEEASAESSNCPVCKDLFLGDNGRVLPCGHEICFDCTLDLSNSAIAHDGIFGHGNEKQNAAAEKEYEEAAAKGLRPCPTCHKMTDLKSKKIFKSSAFEPTEDELAQHARSKRDFAKRPRYSWSDDVGSSVHVRPPPQKAFEDRLIDSDDDDDMPDVPLLGSLFKKEEKEESISTGKKWKGKGKAGSPRGKKHKSGDDEDDVDMPSDAVISNWGRGDDDLEASTKMLEMMRLLKEWEATGDKTICYSQWTSMLDLIEILFSRHGLRALRFDGKMDRAARDAVLATFKKPGGPKIILISTKCGSVGLNLVSANRIINMDLSWNAAAETQAYDRAHRIGQNKEVWVKRLVVENTIEQRMLQLQDVKVGLAAAALGEGNGASLHKMSVKDIKQLFGMAPAPDDR